MNKWTGEKRKEIERYLDQDEDTLYSILDLVRSSETSMAYMPGNEVDRGKALFSDLEPRLRQAICDDWNFCAKRHDPELQDTLTLITGISDIIAGLTIGFPPVLITVIMVKKGLTSFCNCEAERAAE